MNHIEYPERYAAAIKRNIINNAMKTFHRTVEDAKDIINWCDENAYRNEFAAALTPTDDDPKFGFFKRPTKAKIIETKEEEK